ncbi:MAG: hypothetical protein ACXWRE_09210 [Pseudobdellovibrionaceae bacterium]
MTLNEAIEKSKKYLASNSALESIERDPYWPKWDSPWWHMRLLQELNLAKEIPQITLLKMIEVLKGHYLPLFPTHTEEIACHCAVGSMDQVLFYAGIDVDSELPWMRPWMIRYQLPDGGLNCDERAYTKEKSKSYNLSPDGSWSWGSATEFDLFKAVSQEGLVCEPLTKQWNEIQ